MKRTTLAIGGMSCGHCVGAVTRALKGVEGVSVEEVRAGSATVSHDAAPDVRERIARALADQGYELREEGGQG